MVQIQLALNPKFAVLKLTLRCYQWRCLVVGICLTFLAGCATHQQKIDLARQQYWQGNFAASNTNLDQALKRPKRDVEILKLDQAMVNFSQGDLEAAAGLLREVRDRFDERPLGVAAQNASSYLTDDNSRPYLGEDHEKVLVRVMLTLIDLVQESGDAVAYAHQLGQSIDELLASRDIETPPVEEPATGVEAGPSLNSGTGDSVVAASSEASIEAPGALIVSTGENSANSSSGQTAAPTVEPDVVREELAIAPLMRALVRKSSPLNQDDVQRHLTIANEWRPTSAFMNQELVDLALRREIPPGHGSVYLVMFVGRGPVKREVAEPVTSQALLIADRILSAVGEYSLPPTIAPVKIAEMVATPSNVDGFLVSTAGRVVGQTETIADLNRLAVARHQELLPQILARAVVRRIVKKSVVVATKSQLNVQNELLSTAYNLAGVVWEATEQADLRCWSLLPGQIQILRLDLPMGEHELAMYPTLSGQLTRTEPLRCRVQIVDGRATFAIGSLLDAQQSGAVFLHHLP